MPTADHEARIAALENNSAERHQLLKEVHAAVVGSTTAPGIQEQVRALVGRVTLLESLVKWAAGIGTTVLTAVLVAWATLTGTHAPPPAHP